MKCLPRIERAVLPTKLDLQEGTSVEQKEFLLQAVIAEDIDHITRKKGNLFISS